MARGDGKLSHDLLPGEKGPQDACGVFGVWAPGEEVAKLTYYGLYALQHRGQESAGIATSDGKRINVYKDMGLVSQVFDETTLNTLTGHLAVGHCRYSTTGASHWANAQPTLGATATGTVALAHNGNLTNTAELNAMITERNGGQLSGEMKQGNTSDTALVTALLEGEEGKTLEETAMELLPKIRGGFCFVFMDEGTLYAARDTFGIRPLCLGRLERGWVVASEQSALATVGASFIREIEPGEFIAIDEQGVRSQRFAEPTPAGCVFEYVYLARPDASISGRSVYESRVEMGRQLARENTQAADIVIPVPESGTPAAVGYAEESGIPFAHGFVKNSYVGRTFIQPSQTLRQLGIRLKLNALESVIRGKRVVVVDDSIVRGNTQRAIVRMLREAGAAAVHVKISSPPVKWPCFYGIDFASRAELIANGATIEEISQAIGADSLAYISEDGMIGATQQPREKLCTACFTGKYPIELPDADKLGKNLLERKDLGGLAAATGTAPVSTGGATADAAAVAATESAADAPGNPDSIPVTEDPAEKPGATGCDPGPDSELENLLTEADRVPDLHPGAATVGADKKESL
ncbi:amidophosphoribosyltransferase [Arthrobacter sp. D1-17]